ncbi:MAG: hypothetical protein Fur0041_09100 [Bacteroidia bacterium]
MRSNWWKYLSILLLGITFYAGLSVPLAPGLISVKTNAVRTSEAPFKVSVLGYNTSFKKQSGTMKAWITNAGNPDVKTCASSIQTIDDTHAEFKFPPTAPIGDPLFNLHVYNEADGHLFMENAIVTQDTVKGGIVQSCQPAVKNEKETYFAFPFRHILYESIRNLFLHVPMWFTMIALLAFAVYNNIRFLRGFDLNFDQRSHEAVMTALAFGVLGLLTGSVWARATWGAWWVDDVKLNGTAITLLAYLAYMVLRNAIEDEQKRARVSAIYSIFAFVMMLVLIGILPRLQGTDSLHPGNGGNPAFSSYDLDNRLRPIFYSAVFGWILLGFWIYNIRLRIRKIREQLDNN